MRTPRIQLAEIYTVLQVQTSRLEGYPWTGQDNRSSGGASPSTAGAPSWGHGLTFVLGGEHQGILPD